MQRNPCSDRNGEDNQDFPSLNRAFRNQFNLLDQDMDSWFSKHVPRLQRLPVQREIIKALKS